MYFVYGLTDPRNDAIGYIGITENAYQRFKEHISMNDVANPGKNVWIQELKDAKLIPGLKILAIVDTLEEARELEAYWIRHYLNRGANLRNIRLVPIELFAPLRVSHRDDRQNCEPGDVLLTVKQVMSRLKISRPTLYALMERGKLAPIEDKKSYLDKRVKLFFREIDIECMSREGK